MDANTSQEITTKKISLTTENINSFATPEGSDVGQNIDA